MRVHHIEIVDESGTIAAQDLSALAGALQTQIDRDFGPVWGSHATVTVGDAGGLTQGVWPLRILPENELPAGAGGVHLDKNGQPYAIVGATPDWTVAASHELLEMLVDPYGKKLVTGPSIDPAAGGRPVSYLVEVADPCEVYPYAINGIQVSDFVLQDYYSSDAKGEVDQLSKLARPYDVPKGCYISWYDPADSRWHQKRPDGTIATASAQSKLGNHPREQRDQAFTGAENEARHNLPKIFSAYQVALLARPAPGAAAATPL
ncbi:MAG TPA: hypothetical protein VF070_18460 [Streptosporangiaceae bacterium]